MAGNLDDIMARVDRANQERMGAFEKLFSTARADAVFGPPVVQGDRVIITAAEVGTGGGFILAPSHHIQPDTPLENVLAVYRTVARRRGGKSP